MSKKIKKLLTASVCCAALVLGLCVSAFANCSSKGQIDSSATKEKSRTEDIKDMSFSDLLAEDCNDGLQKDETVYIMAGADGKVDNIIVSDWLKNPVKASSIDDKSKLKDIENLKGDEEFTQNDDSLVWDADGNDIYYQGNIQKDLPVSMSVSYKLDGKSIKPDDLAGKDGKVAIRFEYKNNQYETVKIDGKDEKIYVPFAMITGVILDNDIFTNVEVTNGKIIDDGDRTIIAGIAFPGMQSNLNVDKTKYEVPEYIEITADVKKFEMENTVTIGTNEIFSRFNADKFDTVDDLTDSMEELTDAMGQLVDGSSQLSDGLYTLLEKSEELTDGVNKLASGAEELKNGTDSLDSGAGDLLNGAKQLTDGLGQLNANSDTLNAGARQVFDSLLNMANTQLTSAGVSVSTLTVENYADILNGVIDSLDASNVAAQAREIARQKVTAAVNAQKDTIMAGVTSAVEVQVKEKVVQAVRANVETQVLAAQGMTKEQYEVAVSAGLISEEQKAQITAAIDAQMGTEDVLSAIESNLNAQMNSEEIKGLIGSKTEEQIALLIEQNMNSAEVQDQITEALENAQSGAASVSALKSQLDSYNTFYLGLGQYTAGVSSAKAGADALYAGTSSLKAGTGEVNNGINELYTGISTLKDSTPALKDGVAQLHDGAVQLSDGIGEFNDKGIQKLVDAVDGDVNGLLERVRAVVNVSKEYKSFSGISDDMNGQVKFIYRTDSVKSNK